MDYFSAVQEGRKRVNRALNLLQEVAGPSYPMLLLKLGSANWAPVGEEMMHKVVPGKNETAAMVICDAEGNSKAMSAWFESSKADGYSKILEAQGIPVFPGEVKLPI